MMNVPGNGNGIDQALERVLGYLNFSSGTHDAQFFVSLNQIFAAAGSESAEVALWQRARAWLSERLAALRRDSSVFADATQAAATLGLVFERVLPDYLQCHADLLFHQTDRSLFNPYFVGRVCEAVLQQGAPWDEVQRISRGAISRLNDYIGHRPVAALESQRLEPYAHEWVRPLPIFIRGAGPVVGPHQEVVRQAVQLLEETDDALLRAACYDPAMLNEMAVDPRAYDFDHPVNKRPNYHFGQWDPHHIDNDGRYRRYVVQQVTLDALMTRVLKPGKLPADEALFEAAAVLAGTVLMGAGISGTGPGTYDSTVTLTSLLARIAAYRDQFYEQLLKRVSGKHATRLKKEAGERRQPFGGARQHLNAQLARYRAAQLENVHLARIFAQMGYAEAAGTHADVVPAASARMRCGAQCRLTAVFKAIDEGDLPQAEALLGEIVDLVRRAIQCGAFVDPWNIIGFDANFSLFPAPENSIRDHRIDELLELIEQVFSCHTQLWSAAAAIDERELSQRVSQQFLELAQWWHKFAAHEVSCVDAANASEVYRAAERATKALNLWHKGGAEAGNVAFWAPHAEMFSSPKAYMMVVEPLLDRRDLVASMALLSHWLENADRVPLQQGDCSFHDIAELWLEAALCSKETADAPAPNALCKLDQARKFFDYLEANADEWWEVPEFELAAGHKPRKNGELLAAIEEDEDDEQLDLFQAAYEDVVYRDSTDDGIEGEIFDTDTQSEDELERESTRIAHRLAFLSTLARLWKSASVTLVRELAACDEAARSGFVDSLSHWITHAAKHRADLIELLNVVERYRIPAPMADHDSMVQYDRRRVAKEYLLERIITTCIDSADALRVLLSAAASQTGLDQARERWGFALQTADETQFVALFSALLIGDDRVARFRWPEMVEALQEQPLLYVPLAKGGDPLKIVAARVRQQAIQDLLANLPRVGLLTEACHLIDTARIMERDHPVGAGAVTEFDELFKIGYKALVESLVDSAQSWPGREKSKRKAKEAAQSELVTCLEKLTESLLLSWLAHSRTLRLSVLEKAKDRGVWKKLVDFIERYGDDLFTQRFFNLANVRAILHQGVANWLAQLQEVPYETEGIRFFDELGGQLPQDAAIEQMTLVLEAILENYGEYRDYNSTTTQSDRGSLLYTLLDFLRLRTDYDRVAWNLKPVVWTHEILVRQRQDQAARMWRRSLSERVGAEADKYLGRLRRLQKKYAMQMPTVADRLGERFLRPMQIDRIRALVEPAMRAAANGRPSGEFEILEHETGQLARNPTGVGLDVPAWLVALEEEVDNCSDRLSGAATCEQIVKLPRVALPLAEIRRQIEAWAEKE